MRSIYVNNLPFVNCHLQDKFWSFVTQHWADQEEDVAIEDLYGNVKDLANMYLLGEAWMSICEGLHPVAKQNVK